MKVQALNLLPCLLLLASHVPSTVVGENATYDDLKATVGIESPIGTYKYLTYNAWAIGGATTPGAAVGGVADQSPPNAALTAADVQLTNGTPSFTIAEPYKSFGLLDFYFGCVVRSDEGTLGVATQCTITVAGFQANNDQEVALETFTFTPHPQPVTPVPMIQAVLPSTFLLPFFNVTVANSNGLSALKVDNLHYVVST